MESAIMREKQLKKWKRRWKLELIEEHNAYWRDLYPEILDGAGPGGTGFPLSRE
jgi:putative endonuclease